MTDLQPSSLNQTTNLAECAICHQPIPKERVHYGGVSCYSCRAFFRRNTQREELPTCKKRTSCRVTYQTIKQCSACRYSKCLTIGMRPELVLDAKGKQERFKKYLRKKNEERMKAEELSTELLGENTKPMPPLQPIPGAGYPLNVFLHQMQQPRFSYPEPATTFPSHSPPQILNIPFPIHFPMSSTKQLEVESNSRLPSPPPQASPCPVDLTNCLLNRGTVASPSFPEEEFPKTAPQLPPLTKLHRSSVIAARRKMCEEESGVDLAGRDSSCERDEASSSKRRYWPSLHPLLENSLPLHLEIKLEPGQEHDLELVAEESLLHKYCHKKFQRAKTFTSSLTLNNSELENRKRRSVIVQAPSSKRTCSEDLRNFRISKPSCEERDREQEYEEEPWVARYNSEQQDEEDENEEAAPVDLSCSSLTFRSRYSSRTLQTSEHSSDQEVPVVA